MLFHFGAEVERYGMCFVFGAAFYKYIIAYGCHFVAIYGYRSIAGRSICRPGHAAGFSAPGIKAEFAGGNVVEAPAFAPLGSTGYVPAAGLSAKRTCSSPKPPLEARP